MSCRVPTLTVLALLLFAVPALASTPRQFSIQGRLTDSVDVALPAGVKVFHFSIFSAETGGVKIWPAVLAFEAQMLFTDDAGLWSASVGEVEDLHSNNFADTVRWLQIEVDGTILPRVRLVTGPYAYRVATIDGATGGTITSGVSIGSNNTNTGAHSFVAGQSNFATGAFSTIGGGLTNGAAGLTSAVSGGTSNFANGDYSTVGGGQSNQSPEIAATVGGGYSNRALEDYAVVCGGYSNDALDEYAVVCGGRDNLARATGATVGGEANAADSFSFVGGGVLNSTTAPQTVVVGGLSNSASAPLASVLGGQQNSAQGEKSAIGGGANNTASGLISVIAGGSDNNATLLNATVGGGALNTAGGIGATICGGVSNSATSNHASVSGGNFNTAGGQYSTVPGGLSNEATGNYSFAAGRRAKAINAGSFVWGDRTDADFSSTDPDQFLIRATGGVGIGATNPKGSLHVVNDGPNSIGVYLGPGARDIVWDDNQSLQLGEWSGAAFTERMRISTGGHVGIGEAVTPNILTLPDIAGVDGRGLANAWSVYSSRRWKDSIATIEAALSKVERLRGVSYVHTSDGAHDIGLIAEEVGEVIPEVVQYEANGVDAQSVDYARLVALLIEGMKEQQKEIETLKKRMDQMTP